MKVINLDKHDVDICDDNGNVIVTYKASGIVARVGTKFTTVDYIDNIPIVARESNYVINLPAPQKDTLYIVSNVVLNECPDRLDLLAPAQLVTKQGRVVGCRALVSNR